MRDSAPAFFSQKTIFNHGILCILAGLLIFMPLARGGVLPWTKALFCLAVCCMVILLCCDCYFNKTPLTTPTNFTLPSLALLGLVTLSAIFASSKADAIEGFFYFSAYLVLFYITLAAIRTRKQQRFVVYVILTTAILLGIIGLAKRFDFLPFDMWQYAFQGKSVFITASYGNHNHLAGFLSMAIPLFLGLFLVKTRRLPLLLAMIYMSCFLVAVHVMTLSRGGWMSLSASLTIMFCILLLQKRFKRKKLLVAIFASLAIVLLFILSSTDTLERLLTLTEEETVLGMSGRVIAWSGVLEMISNHPLLGNGPGSFATIFTQFQLPGMARRFFYAHNDYLQLIAEVGLLVIPATCWLLFLLLREGLRKIQSKSRQTWGISLGAMVGCLTIIFHSFGDFNLFIPANALLFTVLVALVVGGPGRTKHRHSSSSSSTNSDFAHSQ